MKRLPRKILIVDDCDDKIRPFHHLMIGTFALLCSDGKAYGISDKKLKRSNKNIRGERAFISQFVYPDHYMKVEDE